MDEEEAQEHEVYGGEIPDEGDADMSSAADLDYYDEEPLPSSSGSKELEDMKKGSRRSRRRPAPSANCRPRLRRRWDLPQIPPICLQHWLRRRRLTLDPSMWVDYACTPEEVQQHFQSCGIVNRVTILTDKYGQPKGFAYVEFVEVDAVQNAVLLNETELHGRPVKVSAKRTNIPGMKQYRGRRPGPFPGFRSRRPFIAYAPVYPPYGYGRVPRFRRPMRYRPY